MVVVVLSAIGNFTNIELIDILVKVTTQKKTFCCLNLNFPNIMLEIRLRYILIIFT